MIRYLTRKWVHGKAIQPPRPYGPHPARHGQYVTLA
jgi:hypothetical protein